MTRRVLVIGAGGALGEAITRALRARGWAVRASMRTERDDVRARLAALGVEVVPLDLNAPALVKPLAQDCESIVFTTHLALAIPTLPHLPPSARVLAFSSNNVTVDAEAPTYRALAAHEAALQRQAPTAIIVRPTLIYGDPRLETITRLVQIAQRSPILPLPGSGRALVQPVFVDDLGEMAASLLETAPAEPATYAVGGPDTVSLHALYAAVREAAHSNALIAPTPRSLMALGRAALGARFPLSAEQIRRANIDRCVDARLAVDPAFAPRTSLKEGLAKLLARMGPR